MRHVLSSSNEIIIFTRLGSPPLPRKKVLEAIFICADINNIYKEMGALEKLAKTVTDILDCRIEAVLNDMSITALCDLPEEEAITAEKFLELTTNIVNQASEQLAT